MGSISIFDNSSNVIFTLLALVMLFGASMYASAKTKLGKGIWLLYWGLVLEFLTVAISWKATQIFNQGGAIEGWVFVELLLNLISMILLAMAASQILVNNIPDMPVIAAFGAIGLIAVIYFLFISPDGYMVSNMRQIFPLTGFAYISVSFLSQFRQKNHGGFTFAGLITSSIAIFMALRLIGVDLSSTWFVPAVVYLLLSIALVMMKGDFYAKKWAESLIEIDKYNRRIEEIIKSSPFPIIISRLSDDRIILANTNAIKLFGIRQEELERYRLKDFFADSENRRLLNERLEQEREVQDFEILVKTPSGDTPFWLLTSANVIDYNYDVALYAAFQDITSRKNREVLLKNQAIRDPLTSLFNRRYFEEEVYKRIMNAKIENQPFSVLMIDADHFKRVNDTWGHKTGDKVLIELASTCERALRDVDVVARYGGEEFVIFLADVNAKKAKTVADRLRETISEIVVHSDEGDEVRFTVSIGISSYEVSDNIDTLIKTADEALYKAKENGRNRVEIFNKEELEAFDNKETQERIKNEVNNRHPIFDKEESAEISLLDGIEAQHIQSDAPQIEEDVKNKDNNFYPILGVDEEDLK